MGPGSAGGSKKRRHSDEMDRFLVLGPPCILPVPGMPTRHSRAPSQGAVRLRRGPLAAAAQLARRHAATCALHRRCRPSRVLRPPLQHAAGRGAARYVRDAAPAASVAVAVASRGPAPRARGARKPSSAAWVARRAALLRSCNRAASCAPPRACAVSALCTTPGKQLECARGGGAHIACQP